MSCISQIVACTMFLADIGLHLGVSVENDPRSANPNDASQIVPPSAHSSFTTSYTASTKNIRVTFAYTVDGEFKFTDVNLKYSALVSGLAKIKKQKHDSITAEYESNKLDGTIHGKKITVAKNRGIFKLYAPQKRLEAIDPSRFAINIDRERLSANYKLVLCYDAVALTMRGMYNGEMFFIKYGASLNIVELSLQMNPTMITSNYGIKYTQKYDVSGMEMLDITR